MFIRTMEPFEIAPTSRTPHVVFHRGNGNMSITGCSIPENADKFYAPIHDVIEKYISAPAAKTTMRVELSYFNSSSAKFLLEIMKKFDDLHDSRLSEVLLEWCYIKGDLDQQEAGEDFKELLDFRTELIELPDPDE
ncbi:MAG: DUF1987 domain-containing protein [Flavobacteriales bacterium]|nr:DUF1987 domain-containing protein [Flavobacteriales bacterium]MBK9537002.1 DUF1987 domain-containing protein [Flavobacteriales bacterium]MBP9139129.1 DUF1987 domain-containing protein [Flavobacteriales bacterium]HQV53812.1 DUF1987 domain-containing protein [Flavobacteriales bacterium]HQX30035.1 DUF1987 domain-containing protein [Flavobacteriales bacterium]